MEETRWTYFQFRKHHQYPVFVRFKQEELNPKFIHLLNEFGFGELTEPEARKIPLTKSSTRVLSVQAASARVAQQIAGSDLLDKYGLESLSLQGQTPIYVYRRVGLMVMPPLRNFWELALHSDLSQTDHMIGLRIIFVRFLAQALADFGVLSYWGTVKDDTVIVMKQLTAFGEAVFIDIARQAIFSNGGEMKLGSQLKLLRKDKDTKSANAHTREEALSFLSVSTCLLSFYGITPAMKKAILILSGFSTVHYAGTDSSVNL